MGTAAVGIGAVVDAFASNALAWIVVGIAAYWLAVIVLRQRGLLPDAVGTQGPILTIHTKRGRAFLNWLAGPRRFWRAWANLGVGIALVVMASMFGFLLLSAYAALQTTDPTTVQQPRNVLVIPGVNDFLPLSAAPGIVFGLLVGLVVHEGGHGLLCRVENIDIESMGVVLLAILPIGAFVEPDERSRDTADRGSQTRMFAAGVTNNFAITIVAFALLFGPVIGSIGVAPGAAVGGVMPNSPAADAGIGSNDRITAVDGADVGDNEEFEAVLDGSNETELTVEINGERTEAVERTLLVRAAVEGGPAGIETGDRIVAVDDEPVATEGEFGAAIRNATVIDATVEREVDGRTERFDRRFPVGAYAEVNGDGALASAGAPAGAELVITAIDGERTTDYDDVDAFLSETEAGQEIAVEGYLGSDPVSYEVTLGEHPLEDVGLLGVTMAQGVTGFSVSDVGVRLYPAESYLAALGGPGEGVVVAGSSFLARIGVALLLPIAAVSGVLEYNFAGFTGGIENFYVAQGPLAALGDGGVFLLANALFWTGWINVQLGFFNCIPAFPLDGGHILRTSTEAVISRLPIDATRGMVRAVTTTVGLTMLASLLMMLFGPTLLAG